LANEIEFGKKESYMIKMNDFINSNIPKLDSFYQNLLSIPVDQPRTQTAEITEQIKNNSLAFIYNHLCQNKTKVELALQGDSNPEKEDLLYRIQKIMKEIGQPFEKNKSKINSTNLSSIQSL